MLNQRIKNGIKWIIPYGIIRYREKEFQKYLTLIYEQRSQKQKEIKSYFLSLNPNKEDHEINEIISYFKKYAFSVFPYEFSRKYLMTDIDVFFDKSTETRYVIHNNKRLYFPEEWEDDTIRAYYNVLCIEQDKDSPHCYEAEGFVVRENDCIADIGTAEGIWALNYADIAGKIYLFESDGMWIKALQKTFEPWKEKIVFVNKYVSDTNEGNTVTLDSFFKDKRMDCIKADIEGMEIKLLEGSKKMLTNANHLKLLLCSYHSKNDAVEIKEILEKYGFKTEYSKGYMLPVFDKDIDVPYIRRGVVRAAKSI